MTVRQSIQRARCIPGYLTVKPMARPDSIEVEADETAREERSVGRDSAGAGAVV